MKIEIQNMFVKADVDVKEGDIIWFVGEGEQVPDKWNEGKYRTNIQIRSDKFSEKMLTLNNASLRNMVNAYGSDTKNWVGKEAMVNIVKQMVKGELKSLIVLTVPNVNKNGEVIFE